jgi:hypothetical protein
MGNRAFIHDLMISSVSVCVVLYLIDFDSVNLAPDDSECFTGD